MQSLYMSVVASFPWTLMRSLEEIFKTFLFALFVHWPVVVVVVVVVVFSISFTRSLVFMLQTGPELIIDIELMYVSKKIFCAKRLQPVCFFT